MLSRGRRLRLSTTMTLALLSLLAGSGHAAVVSAFGRRLMTRRGYGFLAPAGVLAASSPSVVVRASSSSSAAGSGNNNAARTAAVDTLMNRRGGATGSGVFGSLTRLFSSGGGDAIRTEAPGVKSLEAAGAGAGEGFKGDLLVLPVFQPEEGDGAADVAGQPILAAWDQALGGALAELVQAKEFKGKPGSAARVRLGGAAVKTLSLVGLGKKSAFKSARALGPATAADIKAEKPKSVAVVLPPGAGASWAASACCPSRVIDGCHSPRADPSFLHSHPTGEEALAAVAEDLLSGLYVDNRFKTGDGVEKPPQVESVKVFGAEAKDPAAALKQARAFAEVGARRGTCIVTRRVPTASVPLLLIILYPFPSLYPRACA